LVSPRGGASGRLLLFFVIKMIWKTIDSYFPLPHFPVGETETGKCGRGK
jgi:hypothetical protein